jgi:hypothetical protein
MTAEICAIMVRDVHEYAFGGFFAVLAKLEMSSEFVFVHAWSLNVPLMSSRFCYSM